MSSSRDDQHDDLIYHPPPPPEPVVETEEAESEPDAATTAVVRRSRILVVTVIAACGTLLLGAIMAIVLLSTGLISSLDRKDEVAEPRPIVAAPEPVDKVPAEPGDTVKTQAQEAAEEAARNARRTSYHPLVRTGAESCGTLCSSLVQEVGTQVGDWTVDAAWADTTRHVDARDAASVGFVRGDVHGTFTVLQFASDAEAAEAAVKMRVLLGQPSYTTALFENGTGVRYDFIDVVNAVLWHPDANSDEHVPGRLYLVESPSIDAPDFSTESAFELFLSLPI